MDKMKMESLSMQEINIKKLEDLFPSCITEGKDTKGNWVKKVDFNALKQLFSNELIDGDEAYEFTWVGKKASVIDANTPIRKTLRPYPEESVEWNSTENMYIEGDNLEALKLLQESYLEKIKMIYIDPPYNTGNDFIYRDDFTETIEEFEDGLGVYDESDNRLFKNTDTNGRFHSDWCSMLYSRLLLARNLLTEDGVIFISIDDHEQENAKKICNEVFGESNFVAELIWERAYSPKNDAKYISNSHDYILMFAKKIENFVIGRLPRTEAANARYSNPDNDPRGIWKPSDMSVKTYNAENDYPITTPSGRVIEPPTGRCWRLSKKAFLERLQDNRIYFGTDGNSVPCIKRFLTELKFDGMAPTSILFYKEVGHSQEGAKEVTKLLEAGAFDGPKPIRLMRRLLTLANLKDDSIVLDFFSGSSSTAHAVMENNAECNKNCKFIMVQIPQKCDEKGEAYQAGYENICEIGKERIRRAGNKIHEDITTSADCGFRVFKIDESNMNDIYFSADRYSQGMIAALESNIKSDRTDLDLLFGCVLDWGLPLSLPYSSEEIAGVNVHTYNKGDLIACFDENVPEDVVKEIAKRQPLRAVFRDSSFSNSPSKINVGEIFKLLAPETTVKVI